MKEYSMELCGVKRTLPFIPISEEMAFASFVVLGDTELVSACAPELAAKSEKSMPLSPQKRKVLP
mgnify:CR=1 FL=1